MGQAICFCMHSATAVKNFIGKVYFIGKEYSIGNFNGGIEFKYFK